MAPLANGARSLMTQGIVTAQLGGEARPALSGLQYKYSSQEPAINRYAVGGQFSRHRDHHALTINVLLVCGPRRNLLEQQPPVPAP